MAVSADNPDLGLGVAFHVEAVQNQRKSKEAGRPIFDNVEHVTITFPGDNKRKLVAPAHEIHYVTHARRQMTYAERFPEVYKAFRDSGEVLVSGTPLSELPALTEAQRAELRAQKIHSIEQLAQLPDSIVKRMGMGARDMREKAEAYLISASGTAEVAELRQRLAEMEKLLSATPAPMPEDGDEFDGLSDDDLRNVLTDAGKEPDGRWGRKRLIEEIRALAEKAA